MIIGLTGGIASGKSAVAQILKELGAHIINADVVYASLSGEGKPLNSLLKKTFSDCVVSGKLDKTLVYKRIFNNPVDRHLLNSITHPIILEEIKKEIAALDKNTKIVVEVPLLFESGFDKLCDCTVCITAPLELRIQRLLARSHNDEIMARKIIAAQLSDDELIKKCDYAVRNDGDIKTLKQRVEDWWKSIG